MGMGKGEGKVRLRKHQYTTPPIPAGPQPWLKLTTACLIVVLNLRAAALVVLT
jgi:hypothetical protein